jgi:trk system potassium uptake protein TrkH
VDLNDLTNASLFVSIVLMAVGGAPCSTAGGVKTTTIAMLVLNAVRRFQGFKTVSCFRKTIPQMAIERAAAATIVFFAVAVLGCLVLMLIEQSGQSHREQKDSFLDLLFEVISALGTVGLSTGITPTLSTPGKMIIMLLMFMGRLGPVSVMVAMSRTRRPPKVEYAHEEPLVG